MAHHMRRVVVRPIGITKLLAAILETLRVVILRHHKSRLVTCEQTSCAEDTLVTHEALYQWR